MTSPLHPNLARLAASYDEIVESHRSGKISAREARGRIAALVGRDDTGLLWTINPDTGRWSYRNLRGELVEAEPPRFGIPSKTPADLGSGKADPTAGRLTFFEVDPANFELPPINDDSRKRFGRSPLPATVRAAFRAVSRRFRCRG